MRAPRRAIALLPIALLLLAAAPLPHDVSAAPAVPLASRQGSDAGDEELSGEGYSLEPCRTDKDCLENRTCFDFDPFDIDTQDRKTCAPPYNALQTCKRCSECDNYPQEVCVSFVDDTNGSCGGPGALTKSTRFLNCPGYTPPTTTPPTTTKAVTTTAKSTATKSTTAKSTTAKSTTAKFTTAKATVTETKPSSVTRQSKRPSPSPSATASTSAIGSATASATAAVAPVVASVSASASVSISAFASAAPSSSPVGSEATPSGVSPAPTQSIAATPTTSLASQQPTVPTPSPPTTPGSLPASGTDGAGDSTEASESPESEVCIGVHHLTHLDRAGLVYAEHRTSAVLCDTAGNCATRGHIVRHKGRAMMMSSYCAGLSDGCRRRVMLVNSPTFSAGRVIPSRSTQLVFTALAARFESVLEERVLAFAVHQLGM